MLEVYLMVYFKPWIQWPKIVSLPFLVEAFLHQYTRFALCLCSEDNVWTTVVNNLPPKTVITGSSREKRTVLQVNYSASMEQVRHTFLFPSTDRLYLQFDVFSSAIIFKKYIYLSIRKYQKYRISKVISIYWYHFCQHSYSHPFRSLWSQCWSYATKQSF